MSKQFVGLVAGSAIVGSAAAFGGGSEHRAFDGVGNNVDNPAWGSTDQHLMRMAWPAYTDQVSEPARTEMPSTRVISNAVCEQVQLIPNASKATNFLWQWGQFLDHDIALSDSMMPLEPMAIEVLAFDPIFDPDGTGKVIIPFNRSIHDTATGTDLDNPRQQINQITAFVDASNVYGSDAARASALRTNDGTGRMKTSDGDLLPYNVDGLPNLGGPSPRLFVAGDIRCNEQVGLTAMHTLFVREHNYQADAIATAEPSLTGDEIFERARARVGAIVQAITYNEFLALLLGPDALAPYAGYDPEVDPSIANSFSASAYRVGHTLLSPTLLRIDSDREPIAEGHLPLAAAFFTPWRLTQEGGIDPILRGLAAGASQEVDVKVIDDVRNFLFLAPDPRGLDLPALNMQRGRDHGLPSYTELRAELGLSPVERFDEITDDEAVQDALAWVYDSVHEIDPWLGGLAEPHVPGAMVGELIFAIVRDQFQRLRDGDRFWYENVFEGDELAELHETTLADVIRRNTSIGAEMQDDVFRMASCAADVDGSGLVDVDDLVGVLMAWGDDGGRADVDNSGLVDIDDLLAVIMAWGVC